MSREKSERDQRLAEALRANLRRRKGQAREWTADEAGDAPARPLDDADETSGRA